MPPKLRQLLVVVLLASARTISAAPPESNAALAKQTSDPASNLWTFQTIVSYSDTPSESFRRSNQFTLELEPTLPIPLTPGLRLLHFPALTLATQGTQDNTQVTGLENFSWLAALSPTPSENGPAFGLGPYIAFPVSSDQHLAIRQWQFGPGGVFSWRFPQFVASTIVKAGWAADRLDREAGSLQIQYNLQYFFGNGSQVGLGRPTLEYTWKRNGSGAWTIPIGVDVAQMFRLGRLPVKVMLEYDFVPLNESRWEPEHIVKLTFIPVLPAPIQHPLF